MLDITKRGGVMLAVMALIGAVMASAVSAQTSPPEAEKTVSVSACVGNATEDHEFVDLDDVTFGLDEINCLAYYGITVGKTIDPPTYDPSGNVTRGQMALFLHRAATVAGVDFTPAADDQAAMFSDISDLGDAWQTAIKALYAKGIMTGRDATAGISGVGSIDTFVPAEPITRAEMGVYLRNFVRAASPDLFNRDGELADIEQLDTFPDAHRGTPGAVSTAIAEIYELGITVGRGDGTYGPADLVTRWQMALFITRALAHTPARPAGLSVQQDGSTIVASIRDRFYTPVRDVYVDMFVADIEDVDDAFDNDGECNTRIVRESDAYPNSDVCEIDYGDEITDDFGNAEFDFGDELTSDGLAVWVWAGAIDDEATSDDVHLVRFAGPDLPLPSASELTVSYDGVATNADGDPVTARRGRSVTVKLQLQGRYVDETELVDVPADGHVVYSLVIEADYVSDATMDVVTRTIIERRRAEDIVLAADGSAEFSIPNSFATHENGHRVTFTLTLDPDSDAPAGTTGMVEFSSAEPVATSVDVAPHSVWLLASSNSTPIRNQVTVTVSDQYGRRVGSADVVLASSGGSEDANDDWDITRTTSPRSPARIIYTYSGVAGVETLIAGVDGDDPASTPPLDSDCAGDSYAGSDVCGSATVYWVTEADDASASNMEYIVKHVDLSNEAIIVQVTSAAPLVVRYTDPQRADRFSVNMRAPRDSSSADLAEFEAALAQFDADKHTSWMLTWDKPNTAPWEFNLTAPELMMG